jgi:hypothetical protein
MDFFFKFLLLAALVSPAPSQAGCVRDTLVALTRKLSAQPNSQSVFQKYFQGSDPAGWKKTIDEEVATTGLGVNLGGNSGGVNVVTLVGGSTVVTKSFPSDPLEYQAKIIEQMERWRDEGKGPEIVGVSLLPGNRRSERRLLVVMEDLLANRNKYGTRVVAGSGKEASILKSEPEAARKWLADRMLSILEKHPDPHPMNVIFRVTRLNPNAPRPKEGTYYQIGDKIYQAFLIDPAGVDGNPEHPMFHTKIDETPAPLLQYNQEWKRRFFRREMGVE